MSKQRDDNDLAKAGELPADQAAGAKVIAEGPRVLTVQQLLEEARSRATQPKSSRACSTGNYRLDGATGGIRPGHVWVFGAETNWGKSSWLVMLADVNLRAGKRVLIITTEDDQSIYGDRLMVRRSRVNARRLRDRELTDEEIQRVTNTAAKGEPLPVFLDARGLTAEQTTEHMVELMTVHKIDLVMLDYLQELRIGGRVQDRRNEVSEVASMIRTAIKRCGRAGVIFSQITVDDSKKRPDKHSIRESRDVSNGAEAILLGCNVLGNDGAILKREILVDKSKDGPKGYTLELQWNPDLACFETQADPDTERAAAVHDSMDGMFEEG